VISLPSKPWKKVRIEATGGNYRVVLVTEVPDESGFLEIIRNDIAPCVGSGDQLSQPDWASRSVTLATPDLSTFKRNLIFACVMVEIE